MEQRALQQSADEALARHGKSFAWAARFLPSSQAEQAARLYAVCRTIDDIADDQPANLARVELACLRAALAGEGHHPLAARIVELQGSVGLTMSALHHLIDGVEQDLTRVRLKDQDALVRYAYRVAGTVGLMMCDVLDIDHPVARRHAIDLGIAMQLTNIGRDVYEDAGMDRRYLPARWVRLEPDDLLAPSSEQQTQIEQALKRLLTLAERYYQSGQAGLDYLPGRTRQGIAIAAAVYREIGQTITRRGYRYDRKRVVVPKWRKALVSAKTVITLSSDKGWPAPHDANLQAALTDIAHASG
ncbi:MAG: phytoene/squalene synthase family protein [Alphaproteobacteria bacterium]|nr:phytoene/squalene synthase family protein [Alphaproteobacteria bacterium SS10]